MPTDHHHRFYVCFSTLAQVRRFPINSSLQVTRFCASSFRNLSFLISSTTHSCHVFLPLLYLFHILPPYLCMLQPNHPYSYVQCAQTISISHAVPHQTHIQYPTDPTTLHSFFYPSMSHHTSTLPSSSLLSPISAYPPPLLPKSHYHTPSPFVCMLYNFFLSTSEKPLSRSKWVKVR